MQWKLIMTLEAVATAVNMTAAVTLVVATVMLIITGAIVIATEINSRRRKEGWKGRGD